MLLKRLLRKFGFDVVHYHPHYERWFSKLQIATVLDIGASDGQYAKSIRALLPEAMIYSFEPLRDSFERLEKNFQRDPHFKAFNVGLGEQDGETTINRSSFSPSSSFLQMADLHKKLFPKTAGSSKETVQIRSLDGMANELEISGGLLVKMDVQGFEGRVIYGGQKTLSRASMLVIETSFIPLYVGQPLFDDIIELLHPLGFSYRGAREQHWKGNELIFQDSIFIKM